MSDLSLQPNVNVCFFDAFKRIKTGSRESRRQRRVGKMPATVYGAGISPVSILIDHKNVINFINNAGSISRVLNLSIDGKEEKVIVKALKWHPYKRQVLHLDFQRVKFDEEIIMVVPIKFIGGDVSIGVKKKGILLHELNEISIKCLPEHLPEEIEIDVSHLDLNESIHLSDVCLPKCVSVSDFALKERNPIVVSIAHHRNSGSSEDAPSDSPAAGTKTE